MSMSENGFEIEQDPAEQDLDWQTAAEQGNRDGDEMVAGGEDAAEVADLAGDDADVDALIDDGIREVQRVDGLDQQLDG